MNLKSAWLKSLLWLALAVACFHGAYASLKYPAAGLLILGYAYGLVRLTEQSTVRRAFYFGFATGILCFAPQLIVLWKIFRITAVPLWIVLSFWTGLFTATACGANRRWGATKAAWLIPILWTGIEYFRSELYYLKFAWLNIGFALPPHFNGTGFRIGTYGLGFLTMVFAATFPFQFLRKMKAIEWLFIPIVIVVILAVEFPTDFGSAKHSSVEIVGVQMEFPTESIIPKALNKALEKNTNAQIFVLSEYTLDGGVPDSLKNWCRDHNRYLVVGGKDFVTNHVFYDTAFVIGTNGDVIFKQAKSVPIQFFDDGLPATKQELWDSPWGKIGICICYDLSYSRVTDRLVKGGAQLLIVPTMDVLEWGKHEHELHARVAPVRAAEYGIPIFRVASSGISQAVTGGGYVVAQAPVPGNGDMLSAQLRLPLRASLPLDRYLAPACTGITAVVLGALLFLTWRDRKAASVRGNQTAPTPVQSAGN